MVVSCHRQFKLLGTTVTNQNCIHENITSRLNSRNAYCHSVQNRLSSRLLSKNVKIQVYRTVILPVLCGCQTWFLTLRAEQRLKMSENTVLRRIFGPKRKEVAGGWRRLLEKLIVTHLVMKFPAFYRTRRFITVFARASDWILS